MVSKDFVFDERQFFYKPVSNSPSNVSEPANILDSVEIPTSDEVGNPLKSTSLPSEASEVDQTPLNSGLSQEKNEGGTITIDPQVIVTYPKYYERKRKGQQLEKIGEDINPLPGTSPDTLETPIRDHREEVSRNPEGVSTIPSEDVEDLPIALRKGTRACVKPIPYALVQYLNYCKVSPNYQAFLTVIQDVPIPKNPQEAIKNRRWKEAMEEMLALLSNHTWDIVSLPKGKKHVSCRWVYTVKCKSDGSIDRYKARLVAQGYTQTYGIDYHETFAPVAKMNTIRIIISLAVNLDLPLNRYDITNAFLNGDLKEEIYMELPPGYEGVKSEGKVCKLRKALYGLKHTPRAWFGRFTQAMKLIEYEQCNGEYTLFFKHKLQGLITLLVYVDDIIITGNDSLEIKRLEEHLANNFQVKQLGPLKYFLGIEFARSSEGILMTQQKYILDLLEEVKQTNCHINDTPIEVNHRLTISEDDPKIEAGSYQEIVGKLIYLAQTRPDICYSVNVLSQFRYLKGTSRRLVRLTLFYTLTLTLLVLVLTTGQRWDIVRFLEETLLHGEVRSKTSCPNPALKQNLEPCPKELMKPCGSSIYWTT